MVCGGALRDRGRSAASSSATPNIPFGPFSPNTAAPASAQGAPPSECMMWQVSCPMISSPGLHCVKIAISLHIVPEGRNTASSLPSNAAIRSHNALMVGSEPDWSSPTSASIIASFIAREGLVCVSEYRLIRTGISRLNGAGA